MDAVDRLPSRTSQSHPLMIAHVPSCPDGGRIGITFCPGKKQASAMSGAWDRDLGSDLDRVRDWGARAVVTLVEGHELEALGVTDIGEEVRLRHMAWYHLPIPDVSTPDAAFESVWRKVAPGLRSRLRNGFDIVIHCKGGLGRAGTVAARLLVELGLAAEDAIAAVRAVRPGAIETSAQEDHVFSCAPIKEAEPGRSPDAIADRAIGAMVGLAIGDAIGTTLEFTARDTYPPLRGMVGGGPFSLQAGEWTDDTAMALALADSLLACSGLDEADLMRRFADWHDNGAYSCTGSCFDIGTTIAAAMDRWRHTGDPVAGSSDPHTAGNGSLMRLAPVAVYFWRNRSALRDAATRQSCTTHAAPAAVRACSLFAEMLADAIVGHSLDVVLMRDAARQWAGRQRESIRGSGYVVESLEAALWSVASTGSFAEAVLTAANLGEDADTTAAIAGQLAGAVYGFSAIPRHWLDRLAWKDRIVELAKSLFAAEALNVGAPREVTF